MTLLSEIEQYLTRTGISAKAFGRSAGCGSSLVYDMRRGTQPKPATIAKVRAFLESSPVYHGEQRVNRSPERINLTGVVRVNRDPCWRCQTRGDIGCVHQPLEARA